MGAYLTKPITTKQSFDKKNGRISCGVSEMQGWRVSMEDAHSCILDYEKDLSFFAVYDGHGGSEVASYTAENLPEFLKTTDEFKGGNLKDCLKNGFLQFDQQLLSDKVMSKLREMAGLNDPTTKDNELDVLVKEAEMPIDELMSKLKEGGYHIDNDDDDDDDDDEKKDSSVCDDCGDDDDVTKEDKNEDGQSSADLKVVTNNNHGIDKKDDVKDEILSDEEKKQKKEEKEGLKSELKTIEEEGSATDDREKIDNEDDDGDNDDDDDSEDEEEDEEEMDDDDDDDDEIDDDDETEVHCHGDDEVGYDSGTTAVVALLGRNHLVVANVGDSRCVLCRNGIALDMSTDHKPDDHMELKRIQNAGGEVTVEGRVNGGLNLSRALGDHRYKRKSDLGADEQQITAFPDVKETEITEADKFLVLACDGIWNVMSSQEVVDFVSERLERQADTGNISLSKICEELFDRCLAQDTSGDGTGCDNMTAIIVLLTDYKNCAHNKAKRKAESRTVAEEGKVERSKKSRTE